MRENDAGAAERDRRIFSAVQSVTAEQQLRVFSAIQISPSAEDARTRAIHAAMRGDEEAVTEAVLVVMSAVLAEDPGLGADPGPRPIVKLLVADVASLAGMRIEGAKLFERLVDPTTE